MKQILQGKTNLNPISNHRLYCEGRGDQNGGKGTRGLNRNNMGEGGSILFWSKPASICVCPGANGKKKKASN